MGFCSFVLFWSFPVLDSEFLLFVLLFSAISTRFSDYSSYCWSLRSYYYALFWCVGCYTTLLFSSPFHHPDQIPPVWGSIFHSDYQYTPYHTAVSVYSTSNSFVRAIHRLKKPFGICSDGFWKCKIFENTALMCVGRASVKALGVSLGYLFSKGRVKWWDQGFDKWGVCLISCSRIGFERVEWGVGALAWCWRSWLDKTVSSVALEFDGGWEVFISGGERKRKRREPWNPKDLRNDS